MKYRLIAVLTLLMIFLSCGCTIKNDNTADSEYNLNIVTTIFPAYDFARQVTGDKADIHMLIKPGSEVHSFEPTPYDIQAINECDIFIYVGGQSDSWIDSVLETVDNPHMKIVKMMDYAVNLEEEYSEGMQIKSEDHSHAEDEREADHMHGYDEHVWTSPVNAIKIVQAVTKAVTEADSANEAEYKANSDEYIAQLTQLDNDFRQLINNSKRKVFVFGDRFPLLHFAKEYGIDYYAAYPGCTEESEPDAKTVAFLIEKVKEENIPVVFHMEMSNEKMTDTICEETGAEKLEFSSCHNVTAEQFEQGITYIDLMTNNLKVLDKAIN